ncbi:hypothetical protein ACJX0J_014532 [Zea mays]
MFLLSIIPHFKMDIFIIREHTIFRCFKKVAHFGVLMFSNFTIGLHHIKISFITSTSHSKEIFSISELSGSAFVPMVIIGFAIIGSTGCIFFELASWYFFLVDISFWGLYHLFVYKIYVNGDIIAKTALIAHCHHHHIPNLQDADAGLLHEVYTMADYLTTGPN